MSIQPFEIDIPDHVLLDLEQRLARTRLPPGPDASDWDAGTSPAYLRELLAYFRAGYDFRAEEARLNRFPQFLAPIDGTSIHFIHQRGTGPAPLPLILTHGFPDSFLRFLRIIPLLTDPAAHGGDAADAFDVVVPSLPGYGFSTPHEANGGFFHIGELWHSLMTDVLRYERYGAHGGDWGSTVTEKLARSHGHSVVGIHLTDVPFWHSLRAPDDPTPSEAEYLERIAAFQLDEGAYAMLQGTRPQTLADGLNDSPAGLAAWLVEKFQRWSDCGGDVERRFSKDELLTNVVTYWVTETIGSSFQPYADTIHAGPMRWISEAMKQWLGSSAVPAGFAIFPKDLSNPPREWAERFFNVQRWSEMPRGGHFAAHEEPELLAQEIRAFFRPLRGAPRTGSL
jgi:pimeloyl-ACP methyl ester carboxylesterase